MEKLRDRLKAIANEYLRQAAMIMEYDIKDCFWIGEDKNGDAVYGAAMMGDWMVLTFDELQVVVNDIDLWVKLWGNKAAVGDAVRRWFESTSDDASREEGSKEMNLQTWLWRMCIDKEE